MAQKLGVHATTVQAWEKGGCSPALPQIPKIIVFLGYVPWDRPPRHLGEKIARARKWLGITQKELAGEIGVDPATLAKWEKGKGRPSEKAMGRLNAVFSQACV